MIGGMKHDLKHLWEFDRFRKDYQQEEFIETKMRQAYQAGLKRAEAIIMRLETDVKPLHAEENGYGCALDDLLTAISEEIKSNKK